MSTPPDLASEPLGDPFGEMGTNAARHGIADVYRDLVRELGRFLARLRTPPAEVARSQKPAG